MSRKALICTIAIVLILAALAWVLIGMPYRAQRQWDAARESLVDRGEKLSLADFPVPAVRDEDNFFADPIWRELSGSKAAKADAGHPDAAKPPADSPKFDVFKRTFEKAELGALRSEFQEFMWLLKNDDRHRVLLKVWERAAKNPGQARRFAELTLRLQAPAEPVMARLRELSQRPDAWFPLDYSEGLAMRYDHVAPLLSAGQWLGLRVRAQLELGDSRAAFQDAVLIFRLKESLRGDSLFIPTLVEASLTEMFSDAIDRGIRVHAWTAEELRGFDRLLATVDAPRRLAAALRMERALMLDVVWPSVGGKGPPSPIFDSSSGLKLRWVYRTYWMPGDQALYTDIVQREAESLDAVPRQGMNPKFFPDHIENYLRTHASRYDKLSKLLTMATLPAQSGTITRAAKVQTSVLLTRIAIALELHRLDHGEYPESLAVLNPGKPGGIPLDLITGEPFRYKRTTDGSFAMWSVGWNEKDEDGLTAKNFADGDWVWGD